MSHCKKPELTGRIVLPGEPQYNTARQEFNTFFNRFPLVIVFAQETQDVINAVRWARYHDVPIRMHSGRHNYEGLSVVDAGIVIDVSEMNRVEVDHKHSTATVQTGIRDFALAEALGSEGLAVPNGLCASTGIAGFTLGGGQSILSRPYGLIIDNLLDLEMVDANGSVLHANADRHVDLFWALAEGNVGAGAGATAGKIYGRPMKSGLGTASLRIPGGPVVAALAVVNALGDIWDRGRIVVGALRPDGTFVNQTRAMLDGVPSPLYFQSTTIAVVATTERLTKAEANRVAKLADDGMARAISPNHTQWDGDTVFCLALGSDTSNMSRDAVVTIVGTAAAVVLEKAIIRGALAAQSGIYAPK